MPGTTVSNTIGGRYQILNLLGMGGMGEVYRAFDSLTRQYVAFKRVLVQSTTEEIGNSELLDRNLALTREFQTLASLRHLHIISVLDYGFDHEHRPYFTMDLLENPQTILMAGEGKPLKVKIDLLIQTLQALAYLHRRGILHRDLKPGNILVVNGQVKVVDLGLAWAKTAGADSLVVGTLAYMAPEVLRGEALTPAVDLYAVGVVAYELLVGRHPFKLGNISSLITDILDTQPDIRPLQQDALAVIPNPDPSNSGRPSKTEQLFLRTELLSDLPTIPPKAENTKKETQEFVFDRRETRPVEISDTQKAFRDLHFSPQVENDEALSFVIGRLLNKLPEDRYPDAATVIRALNTVLGEPIPAENSLIRESFLQAARFVGRDAELAQLSDALSESLTGRGSVWLIGGESGVGKSRLLDELRIRALVTGTRVVRGQSNLNGQAYDVWYEPLRHLVLTTTLADSDLNVLKTVIPDIDTLLGRHAEVEQSPDQPSAIPLDSEQAQKQLLEVIISLINRQTQPLTVILEDLQWSGSESIALIQQLSQFVNRSALFIVGNYRDDEMPQLPSRLPNASILRLQRLPEPAIAELSASMLGQIGEQPNIVAFLHRETEGNVFFLIETVRALAEEAGELDQIGRGTLPERIVTGGINRIVQRRLSRTLPEDYPLLELSAVLGRQLDLVVLRAAANGIDVNAWLLRCADNAVLEIRDEYWRFSHDKLREGILAGIDSDQLPTRHQQAAEAIEAVYVDLTAHASALADHWKKAGNTSKEQIYATLAGDHAQLVGAQQEAITYFQRALGLLSTTPSLASDHVKQLTLLLKLASSFISLGKYLEATEILFDALILSTNSRNSGLMAQALALLGRAAMHRGEFETASRYINQSQQLFTAIGDRQGIATDLSTLGRIAFYQGNYGEAAQHFSQSLSLYREIGNTIGTAQALGGLANLTIARADSARAVEYLQESLLIYQAANYRNGIGSVLLTLGWAMQTQNQYAKAAAYLRDALAIFREVSAPAELAMGINNLGYIAMVQESFQEAQTWFEEGLAISRRIGDQWGIANTLANLGHIATSLGNPDRARQLFLESGRGARAVGAVPLLLEVLLGIAKVDLQSGKVEKAAELFGLVTNQPTRDPNIQAIAEPLLAELQAAMESDELAASMAKGSGQTLNTVIESIFA